ncbi:MAG: NAD-dependent epimerase/dehydratase family protein [cyanobacterium endosymbiont of Rhopalodia musculus]|uniref:NAD-dependent epimerase/dehydratase family protein n=1 Tax=cyanobacterium endosymbiont of Epithemia clementina EcSB TaxID=3034674 RepID=UPI0024811C71|nr:NAD(P)-dependent oxidoreductase [cyanobacterium endosymbiont of Epithemia clementina EcSB]WGT68484.1 NAD(P)-dependent oxidoreductase [cyanobacterium endosymbiont of Epithemia clementina EcSB]
MKRIFLTGASGCIGHYMTEALIQETAHELFLLVRNPEKLQIDYKARPNIHLLIGDLESVGQFKELLKTINVAILAATSWGGIKESYEINVVKMLELINSFDLEICEQIIYFSTASILDHNNQPLAEAGKLGTNYISTKYICYTKLIDLPIADKITTVFPTLVFGGEENKPFSHLSGGFSDVVKWIDLIRWFKADGSFHYIHAKDIAQVIKYLVNHPPSGSRIKQLVLGNKVITVDEAITQICTYLNKRIYFRIPLNIALINFFITIFRLRMEDWDHFSINYRHFVYKAPVTPATFGLENYCTTVDDILRLNQIPKKTNITN